MARVIDYAWGRPSYASLKAEGAIAVCRYLAYLPNGKCLTRAEADGLRANGIDIVSNWEQAGSWAEYSGGTATGRTHATEAQRQHIACGGPPSRPIYFSTDWDATSGQLPAVANYYRGVASVIGLERTGAYGGYRTIKHLFDAGVIRWGWQTYAWSGGQWDNRAQLRQVQNGVTVGGVDCDLNNSVAADFGQWGFNGGDEMPEMVGNEKLGDYLMRIERALLWPIADQIGAVGKQVDAAAKALGVQVTDLADRPAGEFTDAQLETLAAAIRATGGLSDTVKNEMLEIVKRAAREGSHPDA